MILRLMWYVTGLALVGCSTAAKSDWQREDIVEHQFTLISDHVNDFYFMTNGLVAASIEAPGAGLVAPLYYWKLEGKWLHIYGSDEGALNIKLRLIAREGDTNTVISKEGWAFKYKTRKVK